MTEKSLFINYKSAERTAVNNQLMNKSAFAIYKLLKQFDVSSEEMEGLAAGYKEWLKHQTSALSYNVVHYINGEFVSLPCYVRKLRKYEVGIEIDGVCFFKKHKEVVHIGDVADVIESLQNEIFGSELPDDICLRLPTETEIGNLIEHTKDAFPWVVQAYCQYTTYWIAPKRKDSEEVIAEVGYTAVRTHKPMSDYTACSVRPVLRLQPEAFVGHLNQFGMPDEATAEKIKKMLISSRKK